MLVRGFVIAGFVVVAAGCSLVGDDTTTTTATTLPETTTTVPATTTTATTLAPLSEPSFPSYSIVTRIEDATGDTVVVLLDPSSYTLLSDVDLHDVIADVVDRFPPIVEAHVVDSPEAAGLVLVEEPTDEELQILSEHYFLRLEEGFRIVYVGPFAELGTSVLGS
jgi:hypothetical protein